MDETCIIQKWISKREYLFRMFGEFRPTYGGVKVQESRMRENFMYGLKRGQGKRSDGRLERDTLLKEEKHLGSHDLYTTAPLSYSTGLRLTDVTATHFYGESQLHKERAVSRKAGSFSEGSSYHIFGRGVGKQGIFITEDRYNFVMRRLSRYSEELAVRVVVSCLMPNHYRLLLHQPDRDRPGLPAQRVFNSYRKALNDRCSGSGTLFESSFKAKMVDKDECPGRSCRYIRMNPVSGELASVSEQWAYSNHLERAGKRKVWNFDLDFIAAFSGSPSCYEEFVRSHDRNANQGDKLKEYFLDE